MKIEYEKILVKDEFTHTSISRWVKAKGFDIKLVTLYIPLFNGALNVAFGPIEEFKRFIHKNYGREVDIESAKAVAVEFTYEGKTSHWINIQSVDWTAEEYGVIAHELYHATHLILGCAGITYGDNAQEAYAYLLGHLYELTVRAFSQLHKIENPSDWQDIRDNFTSKAYAEFKSFLAEECTDLDSYKNGKYDRKIFNWFKKKRHGKSDTAAT